MIKTILVPGLNAVSTPKAMGMALQVARLFDGHIEQLHVHPDAAEMARYTASLDVESGMFAGEIWQALGTRRQGPHGPVARGLRRTSSRKKRLTGADAVTASWHEVSGNELEETIRQAFYNDLIVFSRPEAPIYAVDAWCRRRARGLRASPAAGSDEDMRKSDHHDRHRLEKFARFGARRHGCHAVAGEGRQDRHPWRQSKTTTTRKPSSTRPSGWLHIFAVTG